MTNEKKVSGAVAVLGAGIAGIQSALDLASAGFKVYLIEESQSIGGAMPKLDKTFPTNDCSMCILAPKLVDTGRHPNIRILCNSEISGIEGECGDFSLEITTHSTGVDPDKCNGCGECVQYCPVSILSEFDERVGRAKAIDRPFPQAIPNVFGIKKTGIAPCRLGCPAEANVQGYLALAAAERWAESLELIKQRIPFPGTLGRICHHPCETKCNRSDIEQPVAIRDIKRFVADWVYDHPELEEAYQNLKAERRRKNEEEGAEYRDPFAVDVSRGKGKKVAVIGAGPAGLTAAGDLTKLGYSVEIFEAEESSGGMMKWVIPEFRLNKEYLDRELRTHIEEHNLTIHYGKVFGKDITLSSLREQGFEAFFIAIGAQQSKGMPIEGSELEGVVAGLDFIRKVNKKEFKPDSLKDKHVVVLGGGNVAMDAARMALRLGAKVTIVYRRSRKEMPATDEEIEMAQEEGIEFMMLTNPVKFSGDRKLTSMQCVKMQLGEPDESGRRRPVPIEGSEFDLPCDMALPAIGQDVDTKPLEKESLELEWNLLKCNPLSLETSQPGVFAGGDVVSGPASVVEAIMAGHEAAVSIDRYLHKADLRTGREEKPETVKTPQRERWQVAPRAESPKVPVKERRWNFNEVEQTLSYEDAVHEAGRCMQCGVCCECMQCVAACGRNAIDHVMVDRKQTIRVGGVIVSPGYEKFIPEDTGSFGFDLYPNVVTSLQFERMLSASGPTMGHLERPSDGAKPNKIAWLQCVGSRDQSCGRPWCSSVCCMYATKEAVIAREHQPGIETHIYYMDIRSFGKNFEQYIDRARDEYGVVFRQSRVPRVEQDPVTKNLRVRYIAGDGSVAYEEYDMVVLSVGMQPCEKLPSLAKLLDLQMNGYGFIQTPPYESCHTTREGIFVAGAAAEPKDIPESVTQASSAAAEVAIRLASARGTEVTVKTYPEERDVSGELPRVGVFVCHCGTNIGSVVDVPSVVDQVRNLPGVVYAVDNLFTCSQDTQELMKQAIKEHHLNRVVVASCTPRTHESLFQDTIREAGLNPYLLQMANIRDQCSWVHRDMPEMATRKAVELVRMTIEKTLRLFPVQRIEIPLVQKALVIGGGIAGMSAALAIADQGFEVFLVEKESELGGYLRNIKFGMNGEEPAKLLEKTINRVNDADHIRVFLNSTVEDVGGYVGNFTSKIATPGGSEEIQHGVVIVATGAKPYQPSEYCYGTNEHVMTQIELEAALSEKGGLQDLWDEVVMIQCVGSRDDNHPYCSRVCCSQAIKNALALKERMPNTRIYILYRDIRTYGFKEDFLYRAARDKGILFFRFEKEEPPEVEERDGTLEIRIRDQVLNRQIIFHPDRLVLAAGIEAGDNDVIARLLKLPLNSDGFFVEAHAKLRPVDFASDGMYLCGTAHSPRFVSESITQARAAASRASEVLSKTTLQTKGITVTVNPRKCVGCEICVDACAYDARTFDPQKGYVTVNEVLCQGCGACAAACPNGATQQNMFTQTQIFSMIDALFSGKEAVTKTK